MISHLTKIPEVIKFVNNTTKIINENNDEVIFGFSPIHNSKPGEISFCSYVDEHAVNLINECNASLIFCPSELENKEIESNSTLIFVENPRLWFIRCIQNFYPKKISQGIHKKAVIETQLIGKNTSIGPYSYIENDVQIGDNCTIYGGVQIFNGTKIGNDVKILPSVIIGDSHFGTQRNELSSLESCSNIGGVKIGNNVEVGSHTSILAGFLEDTVIADGTKISSQVYIGSGMKIGKNCIITGKTYFGGSSIVEDNVYVAPGADIRNGITLSKNSFVGMGAVVVKNVAENTTVLGNPAKPVSFNSEKNKRTI